MKRLGLLVLVLMALSQVPSALHAQSPGGGLDAPGLAGSSSLGVKGTGASKWSGVLSLPTLYVGWLEHPKGASWALQRPLSSGTAPWALTGLWLGATKNLPVTKDFGLMLSGGYFSPRRSDGTWFTTPEAATFRFEIPSYDWWSADGFLKRRVSGPFEVLAGLRYDHTSTRVEYSDQSFDDYILNTYIPIIGAQTAHRFSRSSLTVRFLASPVVWGRLRYAYWAPLINYGESGDFRPKGDSYFMEFFADYRTAIKGTVDIGAFAKWNSLRVHTFDAALAGGSTDEVSWNVAIRSWTFGATLNLGF
ncbi:MAG: hypothetical protein AB1646_04010 [Thermodesulfobacteriota bacterium]